MPASGNVYFFGKLFYYLPFFMMSSAMSAEFFSDLLPTRAINSRNFSPLKFNNIRI